MIIDTNRNAASDLSGLPGAAALLRRRGRSNMVRLQEAATEPGLSRMSPATDIVSGSRSRPKTKVDCGELFRSWAFPAD
jgi:hypothetical protein